MITCPATPATRAARAGQALRSAVALLLPVGLVLAGCGMPDDTGSPSAAQDPVPAQVIDQPQDSGPAAAVAVSDTAVGENAFGDKRRETVTRLSRVLGEPDVMLSPQQFEQADGQEAWYESADDEISPRWAYPVFSATCWDGFCVLFGGDSAADLALRGWELSIYNRWRSRPRETGAPEPGVVLAGTRITLGDPWEELHEAYPTTGVGWAEGATLGVSGTPWRTVFDGVDGWRVSGYADYDDPGRVPPDSVVTRLSAGEGPEPGCC